MPTNGVFRATASDAGRHRADVLRDDCAQPEEAEKWQQMLGQLKNGTG